jgi:hypothetical protein
MKTTLTLLHRCDACLFTSVVARSPRSSSDTISTQTSSSLQSSGLLESVVPVAVRREVDDVAAVQ